MVFRNSWQNILHSIGMHIFGLYNIAELFNIILSEMIRKKNIMWASKFVIEG